MDFFYWFFHQFAENATMEYRLWYLVLEKPFFAPEPYVFGLAWGIIYPLITLALAWCLYLYLRKKLPVSVLGVFVLNILLNFSFTPVLIVTKNNVAISATILAVLASLVWLMMLLWKRSKVAFVLLIPYLLWGAFATALQISITVLN